MVGAKTGASNTPKPGSYWWTQCWHDPLLLLYPAKSLCSSGSPDGPYHEWESFIKYRGLNHQQFKAFLEDSEAEFRDAVYFTATWWLSTGATFWNFFSFEGKCSFEFMNAIGQGFHQQHDSEWCCNLAFLIHITGDLAELNLKPQGYENFSLTPWECWVLWKMIHTITEATEGRQCLSFCIMQNKHRHM